MKILALLHFSSFIGLAYFYEYHSNQQPNPYSQWRYNNNHSNGRNINSNGGSSNNNINSYSSGWSGQEKKINTTYGSDSRRNINASNLNFDKPRVNEQTQCPCVRQQSSNTCFEYDLRRQALNFEEALVYFPDIFIDRADSLKPLSERPPNAAWCQGDPYCKDCANPFMTHLHMKGYLDENELRNEREKLGYNRYEVPYNISEHSDCWKLQFSKPKPKGWHGPPPPGWKPPYSQNSSSYPKYPPNPTTRPPSTRRSSSGQGQSLSSNQQTKELVDNLIQQGNQYWQNQQRTRGKRQTQNATATNQTTANLGQVYQIDCINRGDVIDADGEWVSLCNICWVWRRLPSIYFPTYLNEFICSNDTKCLSGFGECKQRMRPVDLLQNYGTETNPIWQAITIGSSTFCECEARFGSEFHRLIAS